jgi:hypothetical protein
VNERSRLRLEIEQAKDEHGLSLKALTVLSEQRDPYRQDTPASHRDGEWLQRHAVDLGLGDRVIHLRGLHYMLLSGGAVKPNGEPYENSDPDWVWMSEDAAKAARWLGYLPWEQIRDNRSGPPIVRVHTELEPEALFRFGVDVNVPSADDFVPEIDVEGFEGIQAYKLVFFGEKSGLVDVLEPLSRTYRADLYLPAGEISDTLLHTMARVGAADGRPMVVLAFSDCDPAGWQMPISIARKLQAFKTTLFPELEFQVHRVALLPEHVRRFDLPISPLKETEQRKDKWLAAMGVEQTEIDALAALQPKLLRRLARQAVNAFFDRTLGRRVDVAREAWLAEAAQVLESQLDPDETARLRDEAEQRLEELRTEIERLEQSMTLDVGVLDLPTILVPGPELNGDTPSPLIDSAWGWVPGTEALRASKAYEEGGGA